MAVSWHLNEFIMHAMVVRAAGKSINQRCLILSTKKLKGGGGSIVGADFHFNQGKAISGSIKSQTQLLNRWNQVWILFNLNENRTHTGHLCIRLNTPGID